MTHPLRRKLRLEKRLAPGPQCELRQPIEAGIGLEKLPRGAPPDTVRGRAFEEEPPGFESQFRPPELFGKHHRPALRTGRGEGQIAIPEGIEERGLTSGKG